MTCKHGFEWCRGTGKQRGARRPCHWCVMDLEAEHERLCAEVDSLRTSGHTAVFDDYCETVRICSMFAPGLGTLAERVQRLIDKVSAEKAR